MVNTNLEQITPILGVEAANSVQKEFILEKDIVFDCVPKKDQSEAIAKLEKKYLAKPKEIKKLIEQAKNLFANEEDLYLLLAQTWIKTREGNWENTDDLSTWLEVGYGQPGDLSPSPCLICCREAKERGSLTDRQYIYLI